MLMLDPGSGAVWGGWFAGRGLVAALLLALGAGGVALARSYTPESPQFEEFELELRELPADDDADDAVDADEGPACACPCDEADDDSDDADEAPELVIE